MSERRTAVEMLQTALMESGNAVDGFVVLMFKDGTRGFYCTTTQAYIRIGMLYSQLVREEELSRNSEDVETPEPIRQ
jgi:hypothetical protein